MDIINILVISLVQGITEFLPISSSGHLVLLPKLTSWEDQGIGFDVAAHLGSLMAVILFLKRDLNNLYQIDSSMSLGRLHGEFMRFSLPMFHSDRERRFSDFWVLVISLAIGTLPVAIIGFTCRDEIATELRTVEVVAYATIAFGLLLGVADRYRGEKELGDIGLKHILLIGLAQSLALIPGVSRAGVTITAALFLGFSRRASAIFSMLLALPVICLSAALEMKYFSEFADKEAFIDLSGVILFSFMSAYLSLYLLLRFVEQIGMLPFVVYRIIFGTVLIIFFL